MSADRLKVLSSIFLDKPGWHRNPALPILIPLANSVTPKDRTDAVRRLLMETLAWSEDLSSHGFLRIHQALAEVTYSDAEMEKAFETIQTNSKNKPKDIKLLSYYLNCLSIIEMVFAALS